MRRSARRAAAVAAATVVVALPVVVLVDVARSSADTARRGDPVAPVLDSLDARHAVTPLLSARRIPGVVTGQLATKPLLDQLGKVGAALPAPGCMTVFADGVKVYDQRGDQAVVPASNQKLVTAAVALDELGPDYRFHTRLASAAAPVAGRVGGDLFLIGGGDPNLSTQAYIAHGEVNQQELPDHPTSLEALADAVKAAGITEVTGRVVGDDHRYDAVRYVASWPPEYRLSHQAGPLGALMVDDDYVTFDGTIRTADDPARRVATVLTDLLRARGVAVSGAAATGTAPAGAPDVVTPLASAPLSDIAADLLTHSDNNTGELLLKEIGVHANGQGTTDAGRAEVSAALTRWDVPTGGLTVVDGSGLDRGNRLTCAMLTAVLRRAAPDGPLVRGLAVAGETGTLATSFMTSPLKGKLRGKTGTLQRGGVRALSGVVLDGGHRIDFAFVFNGDNPTDRAAPLIDSMVQAFTTYPSLPRLEDYGPKPPTG